MSAAVASPVDTGAWLDGVRAELKTRLGSKKMSQSALATAIACSPSAVSQFVSGKYAGDTVSLARRIEDQLGLVKAREASQVTTARGFVETSISRAVWAVLEHCHVECELGVVTGGAGLGKTMALGEYAERHPTVTVMRALKATRAPVHLCQHLGQKLGVRVPPWNLFEATQALIMHLADSGRLIIIDEAQHLSEEALETVRDLYDETRCGFVLAGNGVVHELVHGTGTAAFAQHFSRLGSEVTLSEAMVTGDDVRALLAPDEVDEKSHAYLLRLARSRGGIRTMVMTYRLARKMEVAADGEPFIDVLKIAHATRHNNPAGKKGE